MFSVSLQNLVNSLPSRNAIGDVLDYVSTSIERLASYSSSATDVIYALSNALSDLNESLEEMNYKSIEKLSKFSGSMMVISLIDETKLNNVLNALAEKKNELSSIVEENNKFTLEKPMNDITSFVQKISDTLTGAPQEAQSPEGTTPEGTTDYYAQSLETLQSIDQSLKDLLEKSNVVGKGSGIFGSLFS
jgi:molecular chaperone GrpE (heat shock protein)